jgi:myotubularin-related protein 1/2
MDYLNKFGNMLNKGVNVVKQQIQKVNQPQQNTFMNQGTYTTQNSSNQNQSLGLNENNQQSSSSMSAFLNSSPSNSSSNPYPTKYNKPANPDQNFLRDFKLIHNETRIDWDNCIIKIDEIEFQCKLLVTAFRLYLIPNFIGKKEYVNLFPNNYFSLPIHQMDSIEKILDKSKPFQYTIQITMKDQRIFQLLFNLGQNESLLGILTNLISNKEMATFSSFAIKYNDNNPIYKLPNIINGWTIYNPIKEFARQGLVNLKSEGQNLLLRTTTLNEKYTLCESYPKFLIVPGNLSDPYLKASAAFRTKNRVPTLSYFYNPNRGSIWRSSQTKVGLTNQRNEYDEELLHCMKRISLNERICIYDARPYLSAYANKLKGAGFENVDNYPGAEIHFCQIENIHTARNALNKIYSLLKNPKFLENNKFYSNFESTGWIDFIFMLIKGSIQIAQSVKDGNTVLIHCSDGWDRASQLTAFSQFLIDPFYKTILGYMTLIEKDFLSFGHQFRARNGYYSKAEYNENQNSPILLQFLDATHQFLVQYPMYFEFNMDFLIFIANNINSGLYGTFLYNNERERESKNAKEKTMSIWTEILKDINKYKNPFYEKKTFNDFFLTPSFSIHQIRFWEEFFMQNTQLSLTLSYNSLVYKYHKNFFNVFGTNKQQKKIMSTFMLMNREKIDYEKELSKKNNQIDNLKKALELIMIKNNPSKEIVDLLNENNLLKKIGDEFGGKFKLDETNSKYEFKKNLNMFDGIKPSSVEKKDENNKRDNEINEENDNKNNDTELNQENNLNNENNNEEINQETNLNNQQENINTNLNSNENNTQDTNLNNNENITQDTNLNSNKNNTQETNLNNNNNTNNDNVNQNIIIEDEEKLD